MRILSLSTVFPNPHDRGHGLFVRARLENIARAGLELLRDEARRARIKAKLAEIVSSLGGPGASHRAAQAILHCLNSH